MKKATLFIGLLFAVLAAHAQYETYSVNPTNNEWEFIDVLAKGDEKYPETFKAIRPWTADNGFDLELIGQLGITPEQATKTLEKAGWYYTVAPLGGMLHIQRKDDGVPMDRIYELVKTLLIGDYAWKFYSYSASTKRATP